MEFPFSENLTVEGATKYTKETTTPGKTAARINKNKGGWKVNLRIEK